MKSVGYRVAHNYSHVAGAYIRGLGGEINFPAKLPKDKEKRRAEVDRRLRIVYHLKIVRLGGGKLTFKQAVKHIDEQIRKEKNDAIS